MSGFLDSVNRFKVFREAEAPSTDSPYVSVDIQPMTQDQRTGWCDLSIIFNVTGKDTEWTALHAIAEEILDIFKDGDTMPAVGDNDELKFQMIGKAKFDSGHNPVTDEVNVSVAVSLGIEI